MKEAWSRGGKLSIKIEGDEPSTIGEGPSTNGGEQRPSKTMSKAAEDGSKSRQLAGSEQQSERQRRRPNGG